MNNKNAFNDHEIESTAIGCAMQYNETTEDLMKLTESDFTHPTLIELFKLIKNLYAEGHDISIVGINTKLKQAGIDITIPQLVTIQNKAISSVDIIPCIEKLRELTERRTLHKLGEYFTREASNTETTPTALIQKATDYIETCSTNKPPPEAMNDVIARRIEEHKKGTLKQGIPTKLYDLDNKWGGFTAGELTVLAARPSMGKTALAQHFAEQFSEPVIMFSLEMKREAIADRMLSKSLDVDLDDLRRGKVDKSKLKIPAPTAIYIDDSSDVSTFDIMAQCRKLKRKKGLGLVIIDFLTLLNDQREAGQSDHQKINDITRKLRNIANKLDVPVLVLAQLNRGVESRSDKRPTMADLRESGGIEEAADNILLLYREEYYNPTTEDKKIVEVIIGKQKQGPRGLIVKLFYDDTRGIFKNLAIGGQQVNMKPPKEWGE